MSHNLEIIDGVATMAYAGETPWHGLGTKVPADLTPEQMCKAAGLDWEVEIVKAKAPLNGKLIYNGSGMLIRKPNGKQITEESILCQNIPNISKWHPCQNAKAFEFFNDFIEAGDMEMETAGSLQDGKIVWALAKIKESFFVDKKKRDEVQSRLLFTNPHTYGLGIDTRFTPTRVVCNNTLTMALNGVSYRAVSTSHRRPFNAEVVKEKLGIASEKLAQYKEQAQFLASKRYTNENVVEYFKRIFPLGERDATKTYKRAEKQLNRGASYSMAIVDTQPGADIAPGTFWNLYNAATFYTNHLASKTDSGRLKSLWFGQGQKTNLEALDVALEMAKVA